jgi:hypothetical protein
MDTSQGNEAGGGPQGSSNNSNDASARDRPGLHEQVRLRALLVARGAMVPSGMLEGVTDTIRIPVRILSGQFDETDEPGGSGSQGGSGGGTAF